MNKLFYQSPIGQLKIQANEKELLAIELMEEPAKEEQNANEITLECKKQLEEYFNGKRNRFNLQYKLEGTTFQCEVWKELAKIPYGELVTYKDIATRIGRKEAVRAVANAIGKNKLLIVIPCHRVIGSNGKLTGFSARTKERSGLEIKQELLHLENCQWGRRFLAIKRRNTLN